LAKDGDPLRSDYSELAVQRLARYHSRAERTFFRSLRELRALQTNRALRDALPAASPADSDAEPDEPKPLPPLTSIAEWTRRTHRPPAFEPPEDGSRDIGLVYVRSDGTTLRPDHPTQS